MLKPKLTHKAEAKINKLATNFMPFSFSLKALVVTLALALCFGKSPFCINPICNFSNL